MDLKRFRLRNPTMDAALNHALRVLTASHTSIRDGLQFGRERDRAIELFELLHGLGVNLMKSEIADWAASHGWPFLHAQQLGWLGEDIRNGKTPTRTGSASHWDEPFVELLKSLCGFAVLV
jgi:hypothetical protein